MYPPMQQSILQESAVHLCKHAYHFTSKPRRTFWQVTMYLAAHSFPPQKASVPWDCSLRREWGWQWGCQVKSVDTGLQTSKPCNGPINPIKFVITEYKYEGKNCSERETVQPTASAPERVQLETWILLRDSPQTQIRIKLERLLFWQSRYASKKAELSIDLGNTSFRQVEKFHMCPRGKDRMQNPWQNLSWKTKQNPMIKEWCLPLPVLAILLCNGHQWVMVSTIAYEKYHIKL